MRVVQHNGRMERRGLTRAPRHVCVVTETYPPEINGVATTLAQLVSGMRARGHRVSLVRPAAARSTRRGPARMPRRRSSPASACPAIAACRSGCRPARRCARAWTRCRPDVVYVATEGPLGWSALRAGAALGVPVYSGFHTNFHALRRSLSRGLAAHPVAALPPPLPQRQRGDARLHRAPAGRARGRRLQRTSA